MKEHRLPQKEVTINFDIDKVDENVLDYYRQLKRWQAFQELPPVVVVHADAVSDNMRRTRLHNFYRRCIHMGSGGYVHSFPREAQGVFTASSIGVSMAEIADKIDDFYEKLEAIAVESPFYVIEGLAYAIAAGMHNLRVPALQPESHADIKKLNTMLKKGRLPYGGRMQTSLRGIVEDIEQPKNIEYLIDLDSAVEVVNTREFELEKKYGHLSRAPILPRMTTPIPDFDYEIEIIN